MGSRTSFPASVIHRGLTSTGWPGQGPRDGTQVTRLAQQMLSLLRRLTDPRAFVLILWGFVVLL